MDFLTLAKERYSCRKFSDKPVEKEKIEKIIEAGLAAPTACNIQPYKIWVMESEESQSKLREVTNFTFGTNVALVVGCDSEIAWVRKYDGRNFADVDGSIVATHLMLAIHELGLGSTWIGFFDAPKLKEIYPEMAKYDLVAIFPIGYPAEDAVPAAGHTNKKDKAEMVKYL